MLDPLGHDVQQRTAEFFWFEFEEAIGEQVDRTVVSACNATAFPTARVLLALSGVIQSNGLHSSGVGDDREFAQLVRCFQSQPFLFASESRLVCELSDRRMSLRMVVLVRADHFR